MILHCRAIRTSEACRVRRYDGSSRRNGMCLSARTVSRLDTCSLRALAFPHIETSLGHGPGRAAGTTHHRAGHKERGARSKEQEEGAIPHWSGEAASPPVFDHHRSRYGGMEVPASGTVIFSRRLATVGGHQTHGRMAGYKLSGLSGQCIPYAHRRTGPREGHGSVDVQCRCCRQGGRASPASLLCACHAVDQITYLPACRPALPRPRYPGKVPAM